METIWREYKNKPDIIEQTVKRGNQTEMVEWPSKIQRNLDIPDNISYYDMGIEDRKNTFLDVSKHGDGIGCMDDRHFREHCVVYGQCLFFIHQKLKADMQPPLQLRPEWIAEKLECNLIDACTLSEAWKSLGFNKWIINKMIFGYFDNENQEWKDGFQFIGPANGRKYAEYFEKLALEFDDSINEIEAINELRGHYYDVSQRMIESGEWYAQYNERMPDPLKQMKWIEYNAEFDTEINVVSDLADEIDEIEGFVDYFGNEAVTLRTSDSFGINKLFCGDESIDHELIMEIKEASASKIKKIQRRFYSTVGWAGRKSRPIYWWMTPQQKSVTWEFIKSRKEELSKYPLSEYSKTVIKFIDNEDIPHKIKRAMIASYCAGNNFNLYGESIKWKRRPRQDEIFAIWAKFNSLIEYKQAKL